MQKFRYLFRKVDGREILLQYRRAHVLLFSLIIASLLGLKKKSLEIVRLAVNNRILCKMRKQYSPFINSYLKSYADEIQHTHSRKVWVCWLQGIENAPPVVKKCFQSLQDNIVDREIVFLTEKNLKKYVSFPKFIQDKIDKGIIQGAHMTDLLRLELLNKYGGTWIDATVYCSGNSYPEYMLDSNLFLFQNLKPGLDGHCTCISNWFMTAYSGNQILLLTQALLYEYWKRHDKLIDYYIFHDFFQLAIEAYPEVWDEVIPFSNSTSHILLLRMFKRYDENIWKAIKDEVCFHKLTYKFKKEETWEKQTYYDVIIQDS
nr:capsular polysaccharide synthesis protein [uncultured Acetatifactor sp.]